MTYPTAVRHVVQIVLENRDAGSVLSNAPFEANLVSAFGYVPNYYAVCHPSLPNYLALTSGNPFECGYDDFVPESATNLGDLIGDAGLSWADYNLATSDPGSDLCTDPLGYNSSVTSNVFAPFLHYQDVLDNTSYCEAHMQSWEEWNATVASGTLPSYSFLTLNKDQNGHSGGLAASDAWLEGFLSPLLNDSFAPSTAYFIEYDEAATTDTGFNGTVGGQVYATVVGGAVLPHSTYTAPATDYNTLATIEWLLDLGHTGYNDTGAYPPMKSLFAPSPAGFAPPAHP
ncbi:MAG: alkaline phosphatase family protein, partial [Thermoplasmata archaeon]